LLALKPANLSMREAAALPLVFITAWEGLVDRVKLGVNHGAGQSVLVIGGGGGVGHVAIQIAIARGATVYAVDGASKAEYLRSLGAVPIDRAQSVETYVAAHTGGKGFDVVYDTVGGESLDAAFKAVAKFGHVVSALGRGTYDLGLLSFKAASYSGVFTLMPLLTGEGRDRHGAIMREATALAEAGKLAPRVDAHTFALDEVEAAHQLFGARKAAGKVVVSVG